MTAPPTFLGAQTLAPVTESVVNPIVTPEGMPMPAVAMPAPPPPVMGHHPNPTTPTMLTPPGEALARASAMPQPVAETPAMRPTTMPPPAPSAPPTPLDTEVVLRVAPDLEARLERTMQEGIMPAQHAAEIVALYPPIKEYARVLTPEAIASALEGAGRGQSPLVRRDGQRFLRTLIAAILVA